MRQLLWGVGYITRSTPSFRETLHTVVGEHIKTPSIQFKSNLIFFLILILLDSFKYIALRTVWAVIHVTIYTPTTIRSDPIRRTRGRDGMA